MNPGPGDPVELYRARSLPEAHAIGIALQSAGIAAEIDDDLPKGAQVNLSLDWAARPRILVARADEPVARALLEEVGWIANVAAKSPALELDPTEPGVGAEQEGTASTRLTMGNRALWWEVAA